MNKNNLVQIDETYFKVGDRITIGRDYTDNVFRKNEDVIVTGFSTYEGQAGHAFYCTETRRLVVEEGYYLLTDYQVESLDGKFKSIIGTWEIKDHPTITKRIFLNEEEFSRLLFNLTVPLETVLACKTREEDETKALMIVGGSHE